MYISRRAQRLLFCTLVTTVAWTSSAAGPTPIHHWLFAPDQINGSKVTPMSGPLLASLQNVATDPDTDSIQLNGKNSSVVISDNIQSISLPSRAISVEAWVAINKPLTWGGIIGCIQDNGDYERGWLLGFNGSQFSFAIASAGKPRLTYAKSRSSFKKGQWYHVVGTYDGKQQSVYVNGKRETFDTSQSGDIQYPPRAFYEIGAYHDDDEHYHTDGQVHEIAVFDRALSPEAVVARYEAKKDFFPTGVGSLPLALGPFVEWLDKESIEVSWETFDPTPSILTFGLKGQKQKRLESPAQGSSHSFIINDIKRDTLYSYRIKQRMPSPAGTRETSSREYEFDATFYYLPAQAPPPTSPDQGSQSSRNYAQAAKTILEQSGITKGYCLVVGAEEGQLAYHIARQSDLKVVAVEEDPAKVATARALLDNAGLYGVRVTVHEGKLSDLNYGPYFANLVVSDHLLQTGQLPGKAKDILYLLRPAGGVVCLGQPPATRMASLTPAKLTSWLAEGGITEATVIDKDGTWALAKRPALDGAGSWSHQYGGTDNAANSQDALVSGEMQVLWWGEPGPRPMPDRGPRNPAPLSVNGHLFVQGNRILFGMDSYNGSILWTKSVPDTRRANMPRDCSNMAASPDHLYVVQGQYCYAIEARSGDRDLNFRTPLATRDNPLDWGYVAVIDDLLLGSAVRPGESYLGDDGEWYEDYNANQVAKMTSKHFFALDRHTGKQEWKYQRGAIINSTITVGDDVVYFIESRNPAALKSDTARMVDEISKDQHVVALDLKTGQVLWERQHDFSKCQFTLYLSYSRNTLIAMGADKSKAYHLYAIETRQQSPPSPDQTESIDTAGSLIWEQHFKAARDHHSGHLQRPVIVGDSVYTDKRAFELRTGKLLRSDLPERRGCGTMSASLGSFFYRHHFHGMWDLKTNKRIQFEGIRSGCWLSLISAGGLLLGPETSAGCSCTHAIQTSVAYVPVLSVKR